MKKVLTFLAVAFITIGSFAQTNWKIDSAHSSLNFDIAHSGISFVNGKFTDYTGEKRSKVAKERRDKDPILFANIFTDGKVSPRMYFIGDWVDDYCDLTLDKMITEISKKEKKNKDEILFNIEDSFETIQSIEKSLFGVVRTKKGSDK